MNAGLRTTLFCFLLALNLPTGVRADGPLIEIFTNDLQPFLNVDGFQKRVEESHGKIRVYNFDDVDRFEAFLSKGLENIQNEADARAIAKQRLFEEIGEDKLKAMAYKAYLPKMMAMKYGIDRFPAIMFNRSSVIYGVSNLNEAIRRWQRWSTPEKG